jgi:hypothetical protein
VHHLQDAGQQSCGFKRTHTLLLQQISQGVDLTGKFPECVPCTGSASTKGVVTLAQRGDDIGEGLQRPHEAINQSGRHHEKIKQQAADEQKSRRKGNVLLVNKDCGKHERWQRE